MLGRKANALSQYTWYVAAGGGSLVARVRPGLRIGEDDSGELVLDGAEAQLELNIGDDGRLMLLAGGDWQFALGPQDDTTRRVDVDRDRGARLQLPNHALTLGTDFAGDGVARPLEIRCLPARESRPPTASATAESTRGRLPPRRSAARSGDGSDSRDAARPTIEELLAVFAEATHTAAAQEPSDDGATERVAKPDATAGARSSHGGLWAMLGLVGMALAVFVALALFQSGARPAGGRLTSPGPVGAPGTRPATPRDMPARAVKALAGISSLVDRGGEPDDAAVQVAVASAQALAAAYPGDPRPRQALENLTRRLASEAMAQYDLGATETARRLVHEAASTGVADQQVSRARAHMATTAPGTRAAQPPVASIQPVVLPAVAKLAVHRSATDRHVQPAAPAAPPTGPAAEPAARPAAKKTEGNAPSAPQPPSPQLIARLEKIGARARSVAAETAIQRDLHAAALAVRLGHLVTPDQQSAFALYSRVRAQRPGSTAARQGLQTVRTDLLLRARAQLGSGDVEAAQATLDGAARAGADPQAVADLRSMAASRQGDPARRQGLVPFDRLRIVHRVAPRYPEEAPRGAEASVDMELTVTRSGHVKNIEIQGDPPGYFVRAATSAVRRWRFRPMMDDGRPVAVRTAIKVTFRSNRR